MKKYIAAALLSLGLILGITPAASADDTYTPGCITLKEYREVSKGMRKSRVHRIFETTGYHYDWYDGNEGRLYEGCNGTWVAGVFWVWADGVWRLYDKFKMSPY